jgi:predicted glycoside hydrolase/deacetylase ChbG (UPF0249 family)
VDALKMVFNYHALRTSGIRHRYQQEFAQLDRLAASRAAARRAGGRDGLVRFHTAFVDKATPEMVAMVPEAIREYAVPGVFLHVCVCLCIGAGSTRSRR